MDAGDVVVESSRPYDIISVISMFSTLLLLTVADSVFKACIGNVFTNLTIPKKRFCYTLLPSTVHAIVVTSLAFYALLYEEGIRRDPVMGKSVLASSACAITIGFMLGDLAFSLWYWKDVGDGFFVPHHLISAGAYLVVTHVGVFRQMAMIRLLAEFSTPFVNLRFLLYDMHMKDSKLYWYNGFAMLFSFFTARILILPLIYHSLYTMTGSDSFKSSGLLGQAALYSATVILDTLNIYWFHKMVRGSLKMIEYKAQNKRSELNRSKGD